VREQKTIKIKRNIPLRNQILIMYKAQSSFPFVKIFFHHHHEEKEEEEDVNGHTHTHKSETIAKKNEN